MTMKKQIIYMVCATALLSSCHIYKAYERPDSIDATGIYRDPVSETDTLASSVCLAVASFNPDNLSIKI